MTKYDEANGGIKAGDAVPDKVLRRTRVEVERSDGVHASEFQRHAGESRDSHENRLRNEVEALKTPPWKCKAQRTADPPQDCDWPTCGCDPYANKVIEALQESGALGGGRAA